MNSSRGRVAVQWFATRHERVKAELVPAAEPKSTSRRNFWTPSEDALIYRSYKTLGSIILGERLGRPTSAIQTRARQLGVAERA